MHLITQWENNKYGRKEFGMSLYINNMNLLYFKENYRIQKIELAHSALKRLKSK